MTATQEYGADSIKVLDGLDAVRHRPGMYIGSTDKRGLHHLVWEIVDNSVDEAMNGHASYIIVTLHDDNSVSVEDDGRGIPVALHPQTKRPTVETVFTTLHAGGKFDGESYGFSGGLHGVGSAVVNAMSEWTVVTVKNGGAFHTIEFGAVERTERGKKVLKAGLVTSELKRHGKCNKSETGTTVRFLPDERSFSTMAWDYDLIARRLRQGAFLNPGPTFILRDQREGGVAEVQYHYPNGLLDFMEEQTEERLASSDHSGERDLLLPITPIRIAGRDDETGDEYDIALRWYPDSRTTISSFANGVETPDGGTHVDGIRQSITLHINRYARQDHIGLLTEKDYNLEGADVLAGLGLIVSVRTRDPQFVGQTKDKLSTARIKDIVKAGFTEHFVDYMHEHPTEAKAFIGKMVEAMRLRLKMAAALEAELAKKEKRGHASGSLALPEKLFDAEGKDRSLAELFIAEGESAAAPAIRTRDALYQAVLGIRGKGLNIEKALTQRDGTERILNNKEVQGLIAAVGAGSWDLFDESSMRYDKIIMLTDADDDGRHIQLLLMTMFYRLMPDLVRGGHLYIARPPLFSTTTSKGEKLYLADEAARDDFLERNPRHANEMTRFKGLGEMNDSQLKETAINPATRRVARVVIEDDSVADAALTSLMGSDTNAKWEALQSVVIDEAAV